MAPGPVVPALAQQKPLDPNEPRGCGFLWSVSSSLLGQGSGSAEGCTDDGDDGKDFHGRGVRWWLCVDCLPRWTFGFVQSEPRSQNPVVVATDGESRRQLRSFSVRTSTCFSRGV